MRALEPSSRLQGLHEFFARENRAQGPGWGPGGACSDGAGRCPERDGSRVSFRCMNRRDAPKATVLPEQEAESWAVELEAWALIREKVVGKLDMLDVRAGAPREVAQAREARRLSGEIRSIAREVRDARLSDDSASAGILLETLGSLRARALGLLTQR